MQIEKLKKEFAKRYGNSNKDISIFFAPGRVNLIGEHTDYNGGYVFPCSLSFGTYLLISTTNDNHIKFSSLNFDFTTSISSDKEIEKINNKWVNYPLGIMLEFQKRGILLSGMELLYYGDIPNGAGLSSSASIELVTSIALNELFACDLDIIEMIKLSQKAENNFVGMNCGIMDQFVVGMGKKDHALFLNCNTLEYKLIPFKLQGYNLIITNSNKQRKLTDSKYNERRAECEKAVEYLNKVQAVNNLSEIDILKFSKIQNAIPDEIIRKRAKHVISENQRVIDAVKALKQKNIITFGKLMNLSHDSLRDDYEVTGYELDILVEEARKIEGVLGSRMTGAGFGGCTVSLVKEEVNEIFRKKVGEGYNKKTGLKADFYSAKIGDRARKIF